MKVNVDADAVSDVDVDVDVDVAVDYLEPDVELGFGGCNDALLRRYPDLPERPEEARKHESNPTLLAYFFEGCYIQGVHFAVMTVLHSEGL